MPISKVPLKPGVNRETTSYGAEGTFYDCDKIRFRSGNAEKIGGWANSVTYKSTDPTTTFIGVGRTMLNWVDYSAHNLLAFGTTQKYYLQGSAGAGYSDITPIVATTTLGANPFSVSSPLNYILVTAPGSNVTPGTFVTFSGATTFNGLNLNGSYEIVTVPNPDSYYIVSPSYASSAGSGGGSAVVATYQLNAGNTLAGALSGWGAGGWGGVSGVATTGWGLSNVYSNTSTSNPLRRWSQCTFNQDLVFAPLGGNIYYWQDTPSQFLSGVFNRGVTLDSFIGTTANIASGLTAKGIAYTTVAASGPSITIDSADYVTSGAYIYVDTSVYPTAVIPAGTYVTAAYVNGTTTNIPLSASVTIPINAKVTFSYAGKSVPNQVLQVFSSPINQFTIAFGSNPYDPGNFNTTFNPMLIRWSDQSNAYEWVPQTSNQSGEQIVNIGSSIVAVTYNRQEILVLTDAAIYSMQYIGPPYVFSFQLLQDNISIASPNAVVTANNITYWMGVDKFYMNSGRVETIPCSVRQYVFSNLNKSQIGQVVAGYNEAFSEIWWFYPSKNSVVNDSYVIYNFLDNAWYYGSLNRTAWLGSPLRPYPMSMLSVQNTYLDTAVGASDTTLSVINSATYPPSGGVFIGSEYITYTGNSNNNLTGCTRGATTPAGLPTTAASHGQYSAVTFGVPNQVIYHENGVDDATGPTNLPIYSFIQTADFGIGDGDRFAFMSTLVPDLSFVNSNTTENPNPKVYLTVYPRQNSGSNYNYNVDTMTVTNTQLPNVPPAYTYPVEQYTGLVYTRVRGRQVAFRIQSTDLGVQWQLGAMRYDIRPDGRR